MNELFREIETVLRGERNMHGEKMITVICDLAKLGDDVRDELHAINYDFAEFLIEGLYDLAEEEKYDEGTETTIPDYLNRLRELYDKAKAMM